MKRINLIAYRSTVVTSDLAEALRQLELRAAAMGGVRIVYGGVRRQEASWAGVKADPGPTQSPPWLSLRPAGREVTLDVVLDDYPGLPEEERQHQLAVLWTLAVPLGFTPWNRYPHPGPADNVFHFLGPWQGLMDAVLGEGRGELAWPSVCAAAQCDVGTWGGTRPVERFVQAQLHRIGVPCGPVNGLIEDRVVQAMRARGLQNMTLPQVAEHLRNQEAPLPAEPERQVGYVSVPNRAFNVISTGRIATTKTPHGVALTIDGPGRVVVDVGA